MNKRNEKTLNEKSHELNKNFHELNEKFHEFRNNVFCLRTSNQLKAWKLWMEIEHAIPWREKQSFTVDWSHYELGEFGPNEFGPCIKSIEPFFE